jgi:putative SOS response-associated peptidase YedK
MCGRYALYRPISRHRKNRPTGELPEWYPGLVDSINARPMRFNVAPTDVMPIVGTSREGAITIKELRWGLAAHRTASPFYRREIRFPFNGYTSG